jgi:hypothetical protein
MVAPATSLPTVVAPRADMKMLILILVLLVLLAQRQS